MTNKYIHVIIASSKERNTTQEGKDMTHVTKLTNERGTFYQYFKGDRVYRYTEKDNLPMTVVKILIDGECYETKYTEFGKVERFR